MKWLIVIFIGFPILLGTESEWTHYEKNYGAGVASRGAELCQPDPENLCLFRGEHAFRGRLLDGVPTTSGYFFHDLEPYTDNYREKRDESKMARTAEKHPRKQRQKTYKKMSDVGIRRQRHDRKMGCRQKKKINDKYSKLHQERKKSQFHRLRHSRMIGLDKKMKKPNDERPVHQGFHNNKFEPISQTEFQDSTVNFSNASLGNKVACDPGLHVRLRKSIVTPQMINKKMEGTGPGQNKATESAHLEPGKSDCTPVLTPGKTIESSAVGLQSPKKSQSVVTEKSGSRTLDSKIVTLTTAEPQKLVISPTESFKLGETLQLSKKKNEQISEELHKANLDSSSHQVQTEETRSCVPQVSGDILRTGDEKSGIASPQSQKNQVLDLKPGGSQKDTPSQLNSQGVKDISQVTPQKQEESSSLGEKKGDELQKLSHFEHQIVKELSQTSSEFLVSQQLGDTSQLVQKTASKTPPEKSQFTGESRPNVAETPQVMSSPQELDEGPPTEAEKMDTSLMEPTKQEEQPLGESCTGMEMLGENPASDSEKLEVSTVGDQIQEKTEFLISPNVNESSPGAEENQSEFASLGESEDPLNVNPQKSEELYQVNQQSEESGRVQLQKLNEKQEVYPQNSDNIAVGDLEKSDDVVQEETRQSEKSILHENADEPCNEIKASDCLRPDENPILVQEPHNGDYPSEEQKETCETELQKRDETLGLKSEMCENTKQEPQIIDSEPGPRSQYVPLSNPEIFQNENNGSEIVNDSENAALMSKESISSREGNHQVEQQDSSGILDVKNEIGGSQMKENNEHVTVNINEGSEAQKPIENPTGIHEASGWKRDARYTSKINYLSALRAKRNPKTGLTGRRPSINYSTKRPLETKGKGKKKENDRSKTREMSDGDSSEDDEEQEYEDEEEEESDADEEDEDEEESDADEELDNENEDDDDAGEGEDEDDDYVVDISISSKEKGEKRKKTKAKTQIKK